jgi:hypothetical protein
LTGYLILICLSGAFAFLAFLNGAAVNSARSKARHAEEIAARYQSQVLTLTAELNAREEARLALEKDLARLRSGAPDARLDASLDVLRDLAARESGGSIAPAPGLADLARASGGHRA